ncbi:MAG: type II toxin-antitoxin system VapB family antitoxin [Betaproteobacteria bacterium]|nr:type II toxin-antitoxin system VapB family antitoxin [Betaproteobacteria bacterium]
MRIINIPIDEALMRRAMRLSHLKAEKAVVEAGLRMLVQIKEQERIRNFRGKLKWTGNLEKMRAGR